MGNDKGGGGYNDAWMAMPIAETNVLHLLQSRSAKGRSKRFREDILQGLGYLHGKALVHNNVKPDNILIHNDVAVIANFGLTMTVRGQAWAFPDYCTDVLTHRRVVRNVFEQPGTHHSRKLRDYRRV